MARFLTVSACTLLFLTLASLPAHAQ